MTDRTVLRRLKVMRCDVPNCGFTSTSKHTMREHRRGAHRPWTSTYKRWVKSGRVKA